MHPYGLLEKLLQDQEKAAQNIKVNESLASEDVVLDVKLNLEKGLFHVSGDGTVFEVEVVDGIFSQPKLAFFVSFTSIDRQKHSIQIV